MILVAAVIAASCFMIALRAMAVTSVTTHIVATGREAARVIADKRLQDDEKERFLRSSSIRMMRAFASISWRTAVAFAAAVVPLLVLQAAGVAQMANVAHALATWQGILLTTVAMGAVGLIRVRL